MVDTEPSDRRAGVSRRTFVKAAGMSGAAASIAGCLGGNKNGGNGSGSNSSGGGSSGGKTTIQWATDSQVKDNWSELKKTLYGDAGLSKDVQVKILSLPSDTDKRKSQYTQWLQSNQATPDVLHMDVGWTIPFIARNQVLPLNKVFSKSEISKIKKEHFDAQLSSMTSPDGTLYGVPVYPDFPIMHYRKDLVKKAGYDPSDWATNALSWKKFSEITKKTMDKTGTKYGYTFQAQAYEGLSCCDFNEWMTSWGGAYFGNPNKYLSGPVNKRPITVTEKPVINAIEMVRTFVHGSSAKNTMSDVTGNIAPTNVFEWIENPSLAPFKKGQAVMHRNWPYAIVEAKKAFGKDFDKMYGTMPICYGVKSDQAKYPRTGGAVSSLGGWNATINPNSKNQDAAKQFLTAMMSDPFRLKMFELIGWVPAKPKLFESDQAKKVDPVGQFLPTLKVSGENAVPRPVTVAWPQESQKIAQQVQGALKGDTPPKQAMQNLKGQLQQIEKQAAQQSGQ